MSVDEDMNDWTSYHAEYVKKSFPGRIADPKHDGHMIPENPKPEDYCTPCCNDLYSYSTGGCYGCRICHGCGDFKGCTNIINRVALEDTGVVLFNDLAPNWEI